MLSDEQEKEINTKMDSLADEYLQREIKNTTWDNVENLPLFLHIKRLRTSLSSLRTWLSNLQGLPN